MRFITIFIPIWIVVLIVNQTGYGNCYKTYCIASAFWGVTVTGFIISLIVYVVTTNDRASILDRSAEPHKNSSMDSTEKHHNEKNFEINTAVGSDVATRNRVGRNKKLKLNSINNNHFETSVVNISERLCWNCCENNSQNNTAKCNECGSRKCEFCSACSMVCKTYILNVVRKKQNDLTLRPGENLGQIGLSAGKFKLASEYLVEIFSEKDSLMVYDAEFGWGKILSIKLRKNLETLFTVAYQSEIMEVGSSAFLKYISRIEVRESEAEKYVKLLNEVQEYYVDDFLDNEYYED